MSTRSSSTWSPSAREQGGRPVERDDPPGVHDADAVAEALGLVEVVRGEQHGRAEAGAQSGDDVDQLVADARVEPDGRLVEEQHPRLGEERAGDLEPPALAAAVGRDRTVEEVGQVEAVGELVDAPARVVGGDAPEAGVDLEVAAAGERPVDDRVLEHDRAVGAAPRSRSVTTSRPCRRAEPDVGPTVVVSMPTVVDLPAPFGPSSPKTSPVATSKSMPLTASTPPAQVLAEAARR